MNKFVTLKITSISIAFVVSCIALVTGIDGIKPKTVSEPNVPKFKVTIVDTTNDTTEAIDTSIEETITTTVDTTYAETTVEEETIEETTTEETTVEETTKEETTVEESTTEEVIYETEVIDTYETEYSNDYSETVYESTDTYEAIDDEVSLLAHVINGEAGAEYYASEMRYYVGSVVLNRVASPNFPNTIYDVIYQSGQYACTWDGNFDREPTEECWKIAKELLNTGSMLPGNVIYQAEFMQGSGLYVQIQNMMFCYE